MAQPTSLRSAAAFAALRRHGRRARRGTVTVTRAAPELTPDVEAPVPRVAYAVGRRCGGAVVRNRIRRRLRSIVRELDLAPGDYLLGAGPEAAVLPYDELRRSVAAAVDAVT